MGRAMFQAYLITCLVTGHSYVGITSRGVRRRWNEHRYSARKRPNVGLVNRAIISVVDDSGSMIGVAIVGNPLSATYMDGMTAEVLRVCTALDAPKNVCSMLYAACWRAWKAMGGDRLLTYTLQKELGTSVSAAGWVIVGTTRPVKPGWRKNDHLERTHQMVMFEPKNRWEPHDSRGVKG